MFCILKVLGVVGILSAMANQESVTTDIPSASVNIDWSRCIFCQETNPTETLKCPLRSNHVETQETGYRSVSQNLIKFAELGALPFDISRLNEGQGIEETLGVNEAQWHRSCQLKYTSSKLSCVIKRSMDQFILHHTGYVGRV